MHQFNIYTIYTDTQKEGNAEVGGGEAEDLKSLYSRNEGQVHLWESRVVG